MNQDSELKQQAIDVLRTIYDPELPVNLYDLGLIYDLDTSTPGHLHVQMTLTSPACPAAGVLPEIVQAQLGFLPGIEQVTVELVWEPPWTPAQLSEDVKFQLGLL